MCIVLSELFDKFLIIFLTKEVLKFCCCLPILGVGKAADAVNTLTSGVVFRKNIQNFKQSCSCKLHHCCHDHT